MTAHTETSGTFLPGAVEALYVKERDVEPLARELLMTFYDLGRSLEGLKEGASAPEVPRPALVAAATQAEIARRNAARGHGADAARQERIYAFAARTFLGLLAPDEQNEALHAAANANS